MSSLAPTSETANKNVELVVADDANPNNLIGQHQTLDVGLAAEGLAPLLQSFHGLLQTVFNLMQLLPTGNAFAHNGRSLLGYSVQSSNKQITRSFNNK